MAASFAAARLRVLPSSFVWREHLAAAALVLGLTLVFFAPVLSGSTFSTIPGHETSVYPWRAFAPPAVDPPQSDQADLNDPWQSFDAGALRSGSLPLWEPYGFAGGHPFFSNGESAVLYPPRVVGALVLSPSAAHDFFLLLHVFLSGICMYLFLRELRAGFAGAVFAGVAWMFGSFNMAWLHLEVVTPISVFLPLGLLLVARAFRVRTVGATVAAGLGLALAIVSGHLVLLGIVCLVVGIWGAALAAVDAVRGRHEGRRSVAAPVLRLAGIAALAVGTAAVVLLPTALTIRESAREPLTYAQLLRTGLAPLHTFLVYTFVPPPLPASETSMHETAFVGTLTAILAVVGFLRRGRGAWLGRGLAVGVVLVATGTPLTWFAFHVVPGFDVFFPYSRLVVFWDFALALLGGLGLDAVLRWMRTFAPRPAVPAVAAAAALAVTAAQTMLYGRQVNPPAAARRAGLLYGPTPLTAAVNRLTAGAWPGRILPVVPRPRGDLAWRPPILFADESWVIGVQSAGGYDSVVSRRTADVVRVLEGQRRTAVLSGGLQTAFSTEFFSTRARFDLAPRLGVTAIVTTPRVPGEHWLPSFARLRPRLVYSGADGRVYALPQRGGPYLVHRATVVPDDAAALRVFSNPRFDFRRRVVLLQGDGPAAADGAASGGRVSDEVAYADRESFRVRTDAPGWAVVPDNWAPGWTATVDGRPAKLLRVNYNQRAVRVPSGDSTVALTYRPPGLVVGAAVSAASLAVAAAALLLVRVRRRSA